MEHACGNLYSNELIRNTLTYCRVWNTNMLVLPLVPLLNRDHTSSQGSVSQEERSTSSAIKNEGVAFLNGTLVDDSKQFD